MITSSPSKDTAVMSSIDPGTVTVTLPLTTSAAETWRLLTEPALVADWFGTLTGDLARGLSVRLDFGDGDFFDITTLRSEPPYLLEYTWRFLGTGPLDTITWHIVPQQSGCLVTVIDSEPGRTYLAGRELKEGWLDFSGRLEQFATTGRPTRYDWRRECDGSIELARSPEHAAQTLFAPGSLPQWLPLSGEGLVDGGHFTVADGGTPALFQIEGVRWTPPNRVQFQLTHAGWLGPTNCELKLSVHAQGTLLSVSHTGWPEISRDTNKQLEQRRRFCALWITILQRAHRMTPGIE